MIQRLLQYVAPLHCLACGAPETILCDTCRYAELPKLPEACARCNALQINAATCTPCKRALPLHNVWCATSYIGSAKEVVYALKYQHKRAVAELIAVEMADTLPRIEPDVVTHIPTTAQRRRERGFDHAELIARKLAALRGWQYEALLYRQKATRQVGSSRLQRQKQMNGAFRVATHRDLSGMHVLVVDDVMSTGSTLAAAAQELKNAGVRKRYAAVFAKN